MEEIFEEEFNLEERKERTRAYRREMRKKHIMRKKRICNAHKTFAVFENGKADFSKEVPMEWYKHDGQYSKGKIHCNCGLCKFGRKYGLPTFKQIKELEEYRSKIKDAV